MIFFTFSLVFYLQCGKNSKADWHKCFEIADKLDIFAPNIMDKLQLEGTSNDLVEGV